MKTPAKEKGQVLVDAARAGDSKEVAKLLAQDDIDVNCEMINGTTCCRRSTRARSTGGVADLFLY